MKNFKTPTLVIHGEQDHRVPLEQGLGMFTALQRQGVPSRLLVFPDENHWVLKPANSVRWYQEVLDWLDRWSSERRPARRPEGMTGHELLEALGHEEVLLWHDRETRACARSSPSTTPRSGPAVGGTRMRAYPSLDHALVDALRLSRAMTSKAALAGDALRRRQGRDPGRSRARQDATRCWRRTAGACTRSRAASTAGATSASRRATCRSSPGFASNISDAAGGAALDTAGLAALGVFAGIEAAAARLGLAMEGLRVAVQGVGAVGAQLARLLAQRGARLTLADVDARARAAPGRGAGRRGRGPGAGVRAPTWTSSRPTPRAAC